MQFNSTSDGSKCVSMTRPSWGLAYVDCRIIECHLTMNRWFTISQHVHRCFEQYLSGPTAKCGATRGMEFTKWLYRATTVARSIMQNVSSSPSLRARHILFAAS